METFAPLEARSLAVAKPIPEAPPVMAMTLPSKDAMVSERRLRMSLRLKEEMVTVVTQENSLT